MRRIAVLLLIAFSLHARAHAAEPKPWPIRAVVIATFEVGADTGDAPGEFQFWVEREHLDEVLDFPGGPALPPGQHALRTNKDHTVLGMLSGTTLVNATASMMALGLDPRFDLSHAYILINGIAGVDPNTASIGSAAWADYVIGDVVREIDPREMPKDWPYGLFPTGALAPNPPSVDAPTWHRSNLYPLNQKLARWAYELTRSLALGDDDKVKAFRAQYINYPNAQRPPFVLIVTVGLPVHGPIAIRTPGRVLRLTAEQRPSAADKPPCCRSTRCRESRSRQAPPNEWYCPGSSAPNRSNSHP